jgi:hypothetical protein
MTQQTSNVKYSASNTQTASRKIVGQAHRLPVFHWQAMRLLYNGKSAS